MPNPRSSPFDPRRALLAAAFLLCACGTLPERPPSGTAEFAQPIAVLTDRRTASASELMATTLVEQRNAIIVGESTCGCVGAVRTEHVLPDGGGLRIAETGFMSAYGRRMEGEPLAPTRLVLPTLADLRASRDPVLEEARRLLKERLHKP